MPGSELVGLVINPKKGKKKEKSKKSSTKAKRSSTKRRKRVRRNPSRKVSVTSRGRSKTTLILTNPARDTSALLQLASGTAVGLAGGKLLDEYVFSHVPQVNHLTAPLGVGAGDIAMLTAGLFMLKKNTRHKEFATGVVAGAGAKIALNVLDRFIFQNRGIVSLHGEEPDYYVDEEGNLYSPDGILVDSVSGEDVPVDDINGDYGPVEESAIQYDTL